MVTLGGVVRSLEMAAGLLLLSGVMLMPALAASITYDFTGDVTGVSPSFPNLSQSISGFMTVDSADTNPNPTVGSYNIQNFRFVYGPYIATMGASGTVDITHGPNADFLSATVNSPSGDLLGGAFPHQFQMLLFGSNNILTSDALPNPAPSISSFALTPFRLDFGFGPQGAGPAVNGVVTTLTAVPLPPAVLLFGGGLVALLGLGAAGLRKRRMPQA